MAKEKEHSHFIYQLSKNENLVSQKDGKTRVATAKFLKPCVKTLSEAVTAPNAPLLFDLLSQNLETWPEHVEIKGWHVPQKGWEEWVDRMAGKYGALWNLTGICDAILSSRYELRSSKDLLLGLVEFWCPETNTFVFPWGEATVTLEDVMILGGFSTLGESVRRPLEGNLVKIEEEMGKKRSILTRNKSKKASHSSWIQHFMGEEEREYEHVAFLSLWLSRYVFPSLPEKVVSKDVFPVAIHLSSNTRIALAPAVLASLYKNLTLLKNQAMSSRQEIIVSGPMQILQLWAFERFPSLGPKIPNTLNPGEPRVARFHRLNAKISLQLVESVLRLADNFRWRPYIAYLENWGHPSYYKDNSSGWSTFNCNESDEDLKSFARCLITSVLVGIDCKEEYLPHRVAMQFGFDQDLPAAFPVSSISWENALFAVPPMSFEPCVSLRYSNWWKKCDLARKEALRGINRNQNSSSPLALAKRDVEKSPASNKVGMKKPQNLVSKLEGCCSSFANENATKARRRPRAYGRMYYYDEPHNPRMPRATVRQFQKIIKPRVSPPVRVERAKTNSKDPAAMCGLRSTCSISQVFSDNISQESHATVDPELSSSMVKTRAYEEYSDTDHIPISKRLKHMLGTPSRRAVISKASPHCRFRTTDSPTSRAPQGDVRKRKFSSTVAGTRKAPTLHERQRNSPTSRIPNGCASKKRCSPIAVRRKATNMPFGGSAQRQNAGSSDQKLKRVVQDGRKVFDHSTNAMEVSEHRMNVEQKKRFEGSIKGTGIESKTRIGEGIPKKSENATFKDTAAGSFQNFGLELESRLRALEEVVGISPK
ncbi:hypothetical protein COLO4_09640 [Corchorus olitorius]|uniref:Aminotransferase-like plant mobile domain-containing protein n=1 Tax=Corchorus olitorius TaxID=93759 RepID=A0A1R3KBJ3_9ROSI|nr:hypothetical protein COLO4_09640 [Corchorus olitorius]